MEISKGVAESDSAATDSERSISTTVAFELAAARDEDPTAVSPLAESLDPDALDCLLANSDADVEITFTHEECAVHVADGNVTVDADPE